jgi:signal transduction histidine kinase
MSPPPLLGERPEDAPPLLAEPPPDPPPLLAERRQGPPPLLAERRQDAEQQLAELSHDLRTPLASAHLLVRALSDGLVEDERRDEYLARIEQQISLLSAMVDDLHSASRARASGGRVRTERVCPHELIQTALDATRVQAEALGISLESTVAPCLPALRVEPTALHRALLNLIDNAIRHAPAGGSVVVRAESALGGIEIEVADDGDGIPPEERDRVFAAFYSGDCRRSSSRSGLGLAIAKAAVEAHGGRIWIADATSGTRVRLWLPVPARRRATSRRRGHIAAAQF